LRSSDGGPISLPCKVLDVRLYFVERARELLDKNELMEAQGEAASLKGRCE
jgi:hypothetical protein